MAKVDDNLLLEGVRGQIGNKLVLKRTRGGNTILCKKPTFSPDRKFSAKQLERQQVFSEATAYASKMKQEPLYLAMAEGTERTGYNVAMADWLHPPRILKVDLDGWNGAALNLIRVRAQDDARVVGVRIEIANETGAILEAGEATESGATWWEYRVNQHLTGELTVTVSAKDLPGHMDQAQETRMFR